MSTQATAAQQETREIAGQQRRVFRPSHQVKAGIASGSSFTNLEVAGTSVETLPKPEVAMLEDGRCQITFSLYSTPRQKEGKENITLGATGNQNDTEVAVDVSAAFDLPDGTIIVPANVSALLYVKGATMRKAAAYAKTLSR